MNDVALAEYGRFLVFGHAVEGRDAVFVQVVEGGVDVFAVGGGGCEGAAEHGTAFRQKVADVVGDACVVAVVLEHLGEGGVQFAQVVDVFGNQYEGDEVAGFRAVDVFA